jgi:hypothetical protein
MSRNDNRKYAHARHDTTCTMSYQHTQSVRQSDDTQTLLSTQIFSQTDLKKKNKNLSQRVSQSVSQSTKYSFSPSFFFFFFFLLSCYYTLTLLCTLLQFFIIILIMAHGIAFVI